jgi:cytochrome c-type biogenesis protein CcmH
MTVLLFAIFFGLALIAAGFAVWPVLREKNVRGRLVLAAAIAALVIGIGAGTYLQLGAPALALRSLTGPSNDDVRGLIAVLAERIRGNPNDPRGWILLGRGYLTLNDPSDAAAAFRRGLMVTPPSQRGPLFSAYGEALTYETQGAVSSEAEAAFAQALKLDPHDARALYYLGIAFVARGDRKNALILWNNLLAETPPNSSLHNVLVDRIAMLNGQAAPDINAMVEGLAARLKANPNDPQGWLRLIRAYSVLGDKTKANAALGDARTALKSNSDAMKAIDREAAHDGLK